MKTEDVIRRAIARIANNGQLTPEQAQEDLKREIAEAKRLAEELKKELSDRDLRAQQAAAEAEAQAFIDDYRQSVVAEIKPDAYPFLAAFEADEVAETALHVANRYAEKTGEVPAIADVLAYIEQTERQKFEARAAKVGYARPAPQAAPSAPRDPSTGRFQPTALPNSVAAERGSAPEDFSKMSERERLLAAGRWLSEKMGPRT